MDSAIVGRLVAARNVLGEECAYPGSTFGSEDADGAWEELSLAVDEIEAEWKSSVTDSGVSFRQDLVKAIAPKAFEYFLAQGHSQVSLTSVKAFVDAILEAENATTP